MWPGKQAAFPAQLSTFGRAGSLWGRALPASSCPMPPSRPVPAITWMVVQQTAHFSTGLHPGVQGLHQNAGVQDAPCWDSPGTDDVPRSGEKR